MIRVHVFEFKKADFDRIPADERALMFLAGHTLNQLGFWIKLIALATNTDAASDPGRDRLNAAQSQILVRSLIALIVEARAWLARKETYTLLKRLYSPLLLKDVLPYKTFNKEYGRSASLLEGIRNGFANHFPTETDLNSTFKVMPEDEDFSFYVTDEHTTSFFFGCEAVIGYGVLSLSDPSDFGKSMSHILQTTVRVANALADFLSLVLSNATVRHFPVSPETAVINITNAPGPDSSLPFYYEGVPGGRAQGVPPPRGDL